MARKSTRKSKFAKAIPGNTMTVTLPIDDFDGTGRFRGFPNWKPVTVGEILSKFPIKNSAGDIVPVSWKISSVAVTAAEASAPSSLVPGADAHYMVAPGVKFQNGQIFEGTVNDQKMLRCKPSSTPTFTLTDANVGVGMWVPLVAGSLSSTATIFSYKGELRTVTISFRLPDNIDLGGSIFD